MLSLLSRTRMLPDSVSKTLLCNFRGHRLGMEVDLVRCLGIIIAAVVVELDLLRIIRTTILMPSTTIQQQTLLNHQRERVLRIITTITESIITVQLPLLQHRLLKDQTCPP